MLYRIIPIIVLAYQQTKYHINCVFKKGKFMYKRLELHNHTTESDGSFAYTKLIDFMIDDKVDTFAITDHNTISGHKKIMKHLEKNNLPISCIYGMEYTTYYGHILCLNLKEYVPWENINLHKPELLFKAAREKGALVGIAHPFSYGHPFARGCRFDMKISDYNSVDFIEIFNNPEPLEVNQRALILWENLVLEGYPLAFTSGMDLHGPRDMKGRFATYVEGSSTENIEKELDLAIRSQKTWISKGPILEFIHNKENDTFIFTIIDTKKPGFTHDYNTPYILQLRTKKEIFTKEMFAKTPLILDDKTIFSNGPILPKLFIKNTQLENLVTVAPTIYMERQ